MKFNELVTEFCRANEEGRAMEGYIVFAPQSFELPYPLQSRTYLVSSDNKRFKKGMSGNSIFGSALDGSDNTLYSERKLWLRHEYVLERTMQKR